MMCLEEVFTIQPAKLKEYIDDFVKDYVPAMSKYGFDLIGLFQTWRLNELWAFWEFAELPLLTKLDQAMVEDDALVKYTQKSWQSRLHWTTKILVPAPFCPTLATVKEKQIKGKIYGIASTPIDPLKFNEWFELFGRIAHPLEEKHGLQMVGYWKRGGDQKDNMNQVFYIRQLIAWESWSQWYDYDKAMVEDPDVKDWWRQSLLYRGHHAFQQAVPVYLPY